MSKRTNERKRGPMSPHFLKNRMKKYCPWYADDGAPRSVTARYACFPSHAASSPGSAQRAKPGALRARPCIRCTVRRKCEIRSIRCRPSGSERDRRVRGSGKDPESARCASSGRRESRSGCGGHIGTRISCRIRREMCVTPPHFISRVDSYPSLYICGDENPCARDVRNHHAVHHRNNPACARCRASSSH